MPDIIVIGGGVIGCSIAYQLAMRGAEVLLVERGRIGSGMTGKSGGFIQTHWRNLDEVRLIARSREIFARWPECGYVRGGYLHTTGAAREAEVRAVHEMLLAEGLPSRWLEPAELQTIQPLLHIDDLVGGTYEASSGWANPLATTLALADAARRHGAAIREDIAVTRIEHDDTRITGIATTSETIPARIVILAAGPWTPKLHVGPALPIELERGQVCFIDRPGGLPDHEVGFYDEVTGLYTHPDGETNLLGIDFAFDSITDADHYVQTVDAQYRIAALQRLAHRFPRLAGARIVREFAGIYDFSPDGQPIVDGPLGLTGYYVAAGFSGTGFKSAPATGLGMAELVLDGEATSVDIRHLRLARFTPAVNPAIAAKLEALRDRLTPDERAKLVPYLSSLGDRMPAFVVALVTQPIEDVVAMVRSRIGSDAS